MLPISRRLALKTAFAAAAAGFVQPWRGTAMAQTGPMPGDPFSLGVASGDPTPDGFVLWTRLAPLPLDPTGGLGDQPVEVLLEVAEDDNFRRVVRSQRLMSRPDRAHAVHAEIYGLPAGREFHYRFRAGGADSPTGRTRTAPEFGAPLDRLRAAWMSCQHYEQGFFTPYRDIVAQNPDVLIHTGDYIYESSWGPQVRRHPGPEPLDLAGYRLHHAAYKLDRDLQAAHAAAPWLFIWDDHEVDNDYAGDVSEEPHVPLDEFRLRRIAAYRAYFEHLPLRGRSIVTAAGQMRTWGSSVWGDLVEFWLTDGRQYRTPDPCPSPEDRGGHLEPQTCPGFMDENQTYFGREQEEWLRRNFGRGTARWDVLVQATLFSRLNQTLPDGTPAAYTDGWDGFPIARRRMTDIIGGRNPNTIILGGDMHCHWAANVKADYFDPDSAVIASEFVTTSITSHSYAYNAFNSMLPINQHILHMDDRQRGYGLAEFTRDRTEVAQRVVDGVARRDQGAASDQARWVIEAGRPGPQRV